MKEKVLITTKNWEITKDSSLSLEKSLSKNEENDEKPKENT